MSLKSAPYYWVVCDGCGVKSTELSEYAAWSDAATAVEQAENGYWREYAAPSNLRPNWHAAHNVHLCDVCQPRTEDGEPWEELP